MHIHASGAAYVVPVGSSAPAQVVWARSLLQGQVFAAENDDAFVYNLRGGSTAWADSFAECASVAKALALGSGAIQGKVVVYISEWPKGAACLRWCLPHAITLVVGGDFDGRWISRRLKHFRSVLSAAGLGPDHSVCSLWSVRFAPRDAADDTAAEPFEDEFNISTAGLLYLVLDFAVGKVREKGVQDVAHNAGCFVDSLVAHLPLREPGAPLRVDWEGGHADLVMTNKRSALASCSSARAASSLIAAIGVGSVGHTLVAIASKVRRASRCPSQVAFLKAVLHRVVHAISASFERLGLRAFGTSSACARSSRSSRLGRQRRAGSA